ncbi:MAG: FHA domain-containing protein [Deltaproteobacteria bacterium]|nr:MAG: FHA domain-containing protein [Deltaproteobacteria bacterium]TNF31592.1 MAG: FHA domain-containing protein [Deltaproteobacteria bacterium]
MKLSVLRDNKLIEEADLTPEIQGIGDASVSLFIGRSDDCHVCLEDQQVSREHAKITYKDGNWKIGQVSDYGGLIVNGVPVEEKELNNGDVITVGPYILNVFGIGSVIPSLETKSEPVVPDSDDSDDDGTEVMENPTDDEGETETEALNSEDEFDSDSPTETETESIADDDPFGEAGAGEVDEFAAPQGAADDLFEDDGGDEESPDFTSSDFEQEGAEGGDGEFGYEEDGGDDMFDEGGDDYAVDTVDDESTKVFQTFARFELELFGESAPFDKFIIDKPETFIGRDPEKCDIVLNDPEVSAKHAVIRKNNITCVLEDLNSGNGTLLNGARINKSNLTNNDEFIIGETTFTVHIISDLLKEEENRLMPVEEGQEIEVQEIIEVDENFNDADLPEGDVIIDGESFGDTAGADVSKSNSLFSKDALKDPEKRKKLLYIAVGLMAAWVLLEEEPKPVPKPKAGDEKQRGLKAKDDGKNVKVADPKLQKKFKPQELEFLDSTYQIAKEYFDQGKYREAMDELEKIFTMTPEYKQSKTLYDLAKQGLAKIEEMERKKQEEIERKKRMEKVKELVERAKEATQEKKVEAAQAFFAQILELDPENFDVPQMKIEIDAWVKEQERIAIEEAQKKAERKRMVDQLAPGKNYYLKKEWHNAMLKLEEFLRLQGMDEDLMKEGSSMLDESKRELANAINPLLGKARSLSEGQDLKGAYEVYSEILKSDPTHVEALNEMNDIREKLMIRSRKIYREAIISESLSLFNDAKEKFQEVQQISPSDSEYYEKATEKLKDYLD